MSLAQSVADVLANHVTMEIESIDRMYLNVYVPQLQSVNGVVGFFRKHRGQPVACSALMDPITKAFVAAIRQFAGQNNIPVRQFKKKERKDDVMAEALAHYKEEHGVVFIGQAQEKTAVLRTEKRRNPQTGRRYAWIVPSTAMVNHFYFYCVDREFGPFFLKFCSYFPYNAKLCLNAHEWAKRQLRKTGIGYQALDNGFLECADPARLQQICDQLGPAEIEDLLLRWLAVLPHPFTSDDVQAGFRYDVSILQAEFSLTQVLDRPVSGRIFFEQVIRENLDIGRPDHVQLIFSRRVTRSTPGRFRTRVLTDGVTPSLHIDYKRSRIKQYHKEGRALRTETTINDARDFYIGKRLCNLPLLRRVGFPANRRLLEVQRISHDCALGEEALQQLQRPRLIDGQRTAALRFTDARVLGLWHALVLFRLLPAGFANRDLRGLLASLLGLLPESMTPGRMTYDLRRLRLHGMIERITGTHRYRVTDFGLRAALFLTRLHARVLRPGISEVLPNAPPVDSALRRCLAEFDQVINQRVQAAHLAA